MDVNDRKSKYKSESDIKKESLCKDLLLEKLEKQIKNLKLVLNKQRDELMEQLDLSQQSNVVMKRQCRLM